MGFEVPGFDRDTAWAVGRGLAESLFYKIFLGGRFCGRALSLESTKERHYCKSLLAGGEFSGGEACDVGRRRRLVKTEVVWLAMAMNDMCYARILENNTKNGRMDTDEYMDRFPDEQGHNQDICRFSTLVLGFALRLQFL